MNGFEIVREYQLIKKNLFLCQKWLSFIGETEEVYCDHFLSSSSLFLQDPSPPPPAPEVH